MKKIISLFIVFVLSSNTFVFANTILSIPTWDESANILEVNAENYNENFLNLESESAILIEQSSRQNII